MKKMFFIGLISLLFLLLMLNACSRQQQNVVNPDAEQNNEDTNEDNILGSNDIPVDGEVKRYLINNPAAKIKCEEKARDPPGNVWSISVWLDKDNMREESILEPSNDAPDSTNTITIHKKENGVINGYSWCKNIIGAGCADTCSKFTIDDGFSYRIVTRSKWDTKSISANLNGVVEGVTKCAVYTEEVDLSIPSNCQ